MLRIQLPYYDEEKWVKLLYIKIKDLTRNKTWSMFKFYMEDPLITVTERVRIADMLNYIYHRSNFMNILLSSANDPINN